MNKLIYDCIIIGSGPAALTAAIYMKRAGYLVNVITGNNVGGSLTLIHSLENYPGYKEISGIDLANNIIEQCTDLGIEFTYYKEIKHFYRIGYSNEHKHIKESDMLYKLYALFLSDEDDYTKADFYTKSVIIANGTTPKLLDLPNENKYLEHGIHTCATCDGTFYKNKNVCVIGGGNTAFSYALYLAKLCKEVTIIHRRDKFKAEQILIDKAKENINIKYLTNSIITDFIEINNKLNGIKLLSNNKISEKEIDGIFYALGSTRIAIPYADFGLDTKVFECGDCILDHAYHQVIIAAGDGAKSAIDCIKSLN